MKKDDQKVVQHVEEENVTGRWCRDLRRDFERGRKRCDPLLERETEEGSEEENQTREYEVEDPEREGPHWMAEASQIVAEEFESTPGA